MEIIRCACGRGDTNNPTPCNEGETHCPRPSASPYAPGCHVGVGGYGRVIGDRGSVTPERERPELAPTLTTVAPRNFS